MRVVLVGAGIAGMSVARALVVRGVTPTVIAPDHGETAHGAGVVSAQFADAGLRALALRSRRLLEPYADARAGHAQIATTARGARALDGLDDVEDVLPGALVRAMRPGFVRRIRRVAYARDDLACSPVSVLRAFAAGSRRVRARVTGVRDGEVVAAGRRFRADRIVLAVGPSRGPLARVPGLRVERRPARSAVADVRLDASFHVVETGFYGRLGAPALLGNGSMEAVRRGAADVFGRDVRPRSLHAGWTLHGPGDRPVVRRVSETTWVVTALGGDGLALGPALGEVVAGQVLA